MSSRGESTCVGGGGIACIFGRKRGVGSQSVGCLLALFGASLIVGVFMIGPDDDGIPTAADKALSQSPERTSRSKYGKKTRFNKKRIDRYLPSWGAADGAAARVGRRIYQAYWADYIEAKVGQAPISSWESAYTVPAGATTGRLYQQTSSDVAFVLPITACPTVPDASTADEPDVGHAFRDAAAILKYGICKQSETYNGMPGSCDFSAYDQKFRLLQITMSRLSQRPDGGSPRRHSPHLRSPWACTKSSETRCNEVFREWFMFRTEFEDTVSSYPPLSKRSGGAYETDIFMGYCTQEGPEGYTPMMYTP